MSGTLWSDDVLCLGSQAGRGEIESIPNADYFVLMMADDGTVHKPLKPRYTTTLFLKFGVEVPPCPVEPFVLDGRHIHRITSLSRFEIIVVGFGSAGTIHVSWPSLGHWCIIYYTRTDSLTIPQLRCSG